MKKTIPSLLTGVFLFVVLIYGNLYLGGLVGLLIPVGDDFFPPLYAAVTMLISVLAVCTYLILKKIDELMEKLDDK